MDFYSKRDKTRKVKKTPLSIDFNVEKSGVLVEWRAGRRKMCHVVLFPTCIACLKYEEQEDKQKQQSIKIRERDIKWIFHLSDLKVDVETDGAIEPGVEQQQLDEW